MSRRTKTFLIALFILAIPLIVASITPIVQRINPPPSDEQIMALTVEARVAQSIAAVPTVDVDTRVNATLISLSATPAKASTPEPPVIAETESASSNSAGNITIGGIIGGLINIIITIVGALGNLIIGLFGALATLVGIPVFFGQCCCVSCGLAIAAFIAKLLND